MDGSVPVFGPWLSVWVGQQRERMDGNKTTEKKKEKDDPSSPLTVKHYEALCKFHMEPVIKSDCIPRRSKQTVDNSLFYIELLWSMEEKIQNTPTLL